jgi:membrane protein implicated in regulation of membrane protease activity
MMTQTSASNADYGVVDKAIAPNQPGRIKFQGTYWKAELADPGFKKVEVGEPVQVVGVQGIRLLVVPEGDERAQTK